MASYRILYLEPEAGEKFRSKEPRKAPYTLRRSHYTAGPEVDAKTPYELWDRLREQSECEAAGVDRPLAVGDALETPDGILLCNYWGFDAAEWSDAKESEDDDEVTDKEGAAGDQPADSEA